MERTGSIGSGAAVASLFAGPCFLTAAVATDLYLQIPQPVILTAPQVLGFSIWLIPATLIGIFVAFPINVIGSFGMAAIGDGVTAARAPISWAAAGAIIGAAIGVRGWTGLELGFAFTLTGAVCASICRSYIRWE